MKEEVFTFTDEMLARMFKSGEMKVKISPSKDAQPEPEPKPRKMLKNLREKYESFMDLNYPIWLKQTGKFSWKFPIK